jgi:hypothetical protein
MMVIVRQSNGYRGELIVIRADGARETRSMTGLNCDDLVEGLALTAALSIDPGATLTLGGQGDETETPAGDLPESTSGDAAEFLRPEEPTRVDASSEAGRSPASLAGVTWALGGVVIIEKIVQQTAHVGGGAGLLISGTPSRSIFPVEFRLELSAVADTRSRAGEGIFVDLFMARLGYCPVRLGGEHSLSFCGGMDVGTMIAESQGVDQARRVSRFLATVSLEAWLRSRLSRRFELWLSPSLTLPLTQREFAVDPGPEVLTSTVSVGWRATSGIAWVF